MRLAQPLSVFRRLFQKMAYKILAPHKLTSALRRLALPVATVCLLGLCGFAAQTPSAPPAQQPSAPHDELPSSDSVLLHLNAVIQWYQATKENVQPVGQPTDEIYADNLRSQALTIAQLAFTSAEAQAALISSLQGKDADNTDTTAQGFANPQNLEKVVQQTKDRNAQLASHLAALNAQIGATANDKAKSALTGQRDRIQGELDLGNTMLKSVQQMSVFVNQNGDSGGSGLLGNIVQLQRGVPEIAETSAKKTAQPQTSPIKQISNSTGLIGEAGSLYSEVETLSAIRALGRQLDAAETAATNLRDPARQMLRNTLQQGQALSNLSDTSPTNTSQAVTPPPDQALPVTANFDALSAKFSKVSAVVLPLSQELILLDQAKANLNEWHDAVGREYSLLLRSLLTRVATIAVVLAVILLLSEFWKRMTFRYISDYRRRRQFLLMRRFVMGFLMTLVVILGFVSEFSSLATFAGFITAGLAVGLQTILLSVAAYFFLIGRYGIRVGDRISIAGVTGDVIDVGLVRLYIMELGGTGVDLYPTGRLVVFSNAVLFQAATPLFKQIPGTEYAWHEVAFAANPAANLKGLEEKLLTAVDSVFQHYRAELDRQHGDIEKRVEVQIRPPQLQSLLQFSDTGLEAVVRYPVLLIHLSEMDDKVTRALLALMDSDADLKEAVSGLPKIRTAVKQ
jgi:small-conductance mechanosensitive channel